MAGWFDDLQMRVKQLSDAVPKDINDAFNKVAKDEFVKFGQKALGNLSAKDIAEGQRGDNSNAQIANDTQAPAAMNANQASQVGSMGAQIMQFWPLILGGGVAMYFLLKKRRG